MRNSILLGFCLVLLSSVASAGGRWHATYQVSITNLTKGVSFTPLLNVAHSRHISVFELGEVATDGLAAMAEGGALDALIDEVTSADSRAMTAASEGLLAPGQTVTVELVSRKYQVFSLAAMLLPTNDTFVALNGVSLPYYGSYTYLANAYDAGSETNDESCLNIPGPTCGGTPFSPEDEGEGYVYPSPGLHGEGDLALSAYNWQGPVAKVVIRRTR